VSKLEGARNGSALLAVAGAVRRWCRHSAVGRLLASEWVVQTLIGMVLLVSMASVIESNMTTATKFLSFALLFVVTAVLTVGIAQKTAE
jgi:hypothetical protein